MPKSSSRRLSLLALTFCASAGAMAFLGLIRTTVDSSGLRGEVVGGIVNFTAEQTKQGVVIPADTDVVLICEGSQAFPVGEIRGYGWGYRYTMNEVTEGWTGDYHASKSYVDRDPTLADAEPFMIAPNAFYYFHLDTAQAFICGRGFDVRVDTSADMPAEQDHPSAGDPDVTLDPPAWPAGLEASLLGCTQGGAVSLMANEAPFVSVDGSNVAYTFSSDPQYTTEAGVAAPARQDGYWYRFGWDGPRRIGREVLDMEYNGSRLLVRMDDGRIDLVDMSAGGSSTIPVSGTVGHAFVAGDYVTYTDVTSPAPVLYVYNLRTGETADIGTVDPAYGRKGIVANAQSVTFIGDGKTQVYMLESGTYGESSAAPDISTLTDDGWLRGNTLFNENVTPLIDAKRLGEPQSSFYLAGAYRAVGDYEVFTMSRFTQGGIKSFVSPQQNVYVFNKSTGTLRLVGEEANADCSFDPSAEDAPSIDMPLIKRVQSEERDSPVAVDPSEGKSQLSVENVNPDANGSNVPTGKSDIAAFRFTASPDREEVATVTDLIFNVKAVNLKLDAEGYFLYNKANDTLKTKCDVVESLGNETFFVACRNLPESLMSAVKPGGSTTLVLEADIDTPKELANQMSLLQVTLTDITDAEEDGLSAKDSHIRWVDGDATSDKEFLFIDQSAPIVKSTSYMN